MIKLVSLIYTLLLAVVQLPTLSSAQTCTSFVPFYNNKNSTNPVYTKVDRRFDIAISDTYRCNSTTTPCWFGDPRIWGSTPPTNQTTINAPVGGLLTVNATITTGNQSQGSYINSGPATSYGLNLSNPDTQRLFAPLAQVLLIRAQVTMNISGYGFYAPANTITSYQADFRPSYVCVNGTVSGCSSTDSNFSNNTIVELCVPAEVESTPYCVATSTSHCLRGEVGVFGSAGARCQSCQTATNDGSSVMGMQMTWLIAVVVTIGMMLL